MLLTRLQGKNYSADDDVNGFKRSVRLSLCLFFRFLLQSARSATMSRWASFILAFLRNTTTSNLAALIYLLFHVFSGIPSDVIHAGLYKCCFSWSVFSMTVGSSFFARKS